jgi:TolA-binding protein
MARWAIGGLAAIAVAVAAPRAISIAADSKAASADHRQIAEQERELVRKVYEARDNYQAALERLRAYYVHTNIDEQRHWCEKELTDYHLVLKSPYILDMDLPSLDLRPDTASPKANRIFREALDWYNKRTMGDRSENFKRAELLLRRLLRDYPRSDKLDEACYYLGDIYASRSFQQYARAAAFFERVLHYEPNTNLDARYRAAYLYDKHLNDQKRAVEMYQQILRQEVDPNQTREARKRLDDILNTRSSSRP